MPSAIDPSDTRFRFGQSAETLAGVLFLTARLRDPYHIILFHYMQSDRNPPGTRVCFNRSAVSLAGLPLLRGRRRVPFLYPASSAADPTALKGFLIKNRIRLITAYKINLYNKVEIP